jgi:hypothetical protein
MKNQKAGILCLLFSFFSLFLYAQNLPVREPDRNKPLLFSQMPDKMSISAASLESLLQYETDKKVSINLSNDIIFQGTVSSVSARHEPGVSSVVIRSDNFQGASLTVSRLSRANGTSYFIGRIISFQHGDGYEITLESDRYYLIKKGFYDMVNE